MATARIIPESLHGVLFDLYGEVDPNLGRRRTYRDLSAWLLTEHGLKTDHKMVRAVVEPLRQERAELRREVLRDRLLAQITPQVDTLDHLMVKAQALTNDGPKGKKPSAAVVLDTLDAFRKAVETKLRFAGIGERHETSGDLDLTSNGGNPMTLYVPRKNNDDGEPGDE